MFKIQLIMLFILFSNSTIIKSIDFEIINRDPYKT